MQLGKSQVGSAALEQTWKSVGVAGAVPLAVMHRKIHRHFTILLGSNFTASGFFLGLNTEGQSLNVMKHQEEQLEMSAREDRETGSPTS